MLLRRELLKTALLATTNDETRYVLSAVQVQPDGSVRATDGHILVYARDPHPQEDADFPTVAGAQPITAPSAPVLLPADLAKRLLAGMPKKSTVPVLGCVQLGTVNGGGGVQAVSTDLSVPVIADLTAAQALQFPSTDRVMVTDGQRPAVIKLCLSAEMLTRLAQIAREAGRAKGTNVVALEIPTDPVYQGKRWEGDGDATAQVPNGNLESAVRFTCGTEVTVEGVVMPCRIDQVPRVPRDQVPALQASRTAQAVTLGEPSGPPTAVLPGD